MINHPLNCDQLCYPVQEGGVNVYKDVNILANHLHGFYGNPGTENIACDPLPDNTSNCYRGDNIFADIPPGTCNYYQYDVADVASPGALWYELNSVWCQTLLCQVALELLPQLVQCLPSWMLSALFTHLQ